MATQPLKRTRHDQYLDDTHYERFNGAASERPVPGLEHAELQRLMVDLLLPFAAQLGGKVLQEWSISDGSADWLTPDVTFSNPEIKTTRRGHLLAPAYLVVEIRSPDQALKVLFSKREQYRKWRIPYYWIVDPIESACYECSTTGVEWAGIIPRADTLRAGTIEVPVNAILRG